MLQNFGMKDNMFWKILKNYIQSIRIVPSMHMALINGEILRALVEKIVAEEEVDEETAKEKVKRILNGTISVEELKKIKYGHTYMTEKYSDKFKAEISDEDAKIYIGATKNLLMWDETEIGAYRM